MGQKRRKNISHKENLWEKYWIIIRTTKSFRI